MIWGDPGQLQPPLCVKTPRALYLRPNPNHRHTSQTSADTAALALSCNQRFPLLLVNITYVFNFLKFLDFPGSAFVARCFIAKSAQSSTLPELELQINVSSPKEQIYVTIFAHLIIQCQFSFINLSGSSCEALKSSSMGIERNQRSKLHMESESQL